MQEIQDCSWQDRDGRTLILVRVKPNSKRTGIDGIIPVETPYPVKNALNISISAPAEDNKANRELIKFMSKHIDIPKSKITIRHGIKNRLKVLQIHLKHR